MIPYLLMLLLVGLPAFFVELTVGQYARVGANKVFGRMVPAFKVIRLCERNFFWIFMFRVLDTACSL